MPADDKSPVGGSSRAATRNGAKKANPEKVKAAVAETKPAGETAVAVAEAPKPKVVKYRDLELTLPDELPPAVLFDLVDLEADAQNPLPVFRLLRSILGQDQFVQVRNSLSMTDGFEDVETLLDDVFGNFGVSLGE